MEVDHRAMLSRQRVMKMRLLWPTRRRLFLFDGPFCVRGTIPTNHMKMLMDERIGNLLSP